MYKRQAQALLAGQLDVDGQAVGQQAQPPGEEGVGPRDGLGVDLSLIHICSVIAAAALTILPEALRQFSNYRMLVYAIVLILVMLATNNPTLKGFFSRLFHRERADAPHAAAVKGGGRQ